METFESQVEVEIWHSDFPGTHSAQPVTIRWELDLEMRSWGVKDINIYVPEQEILLLYDAENAEGDVIDAEKTIRLRNVDVAIVEGFTGLIAPRSLQISDDAITVEF